MSAPWLLLVGALGLGAGHAAALIATRVLAERDDVDEPVPNWVRPVAAVWSAALFVTVGAVLGGVWVLPAFLTFIGITVTVTITDIHCRLIPNRINFWGLGLAGGLLLVGSAIDGDLAALQRGAIGGVAYFAVLYALWLFTAGRIMGGGDVKLTPLLGLFSAYIGWDAYIVAIFGGIFLGGIAGLILVVGRMAKLKDHFAYGPPLVLGTYVGIAWGTEILDWYLRS